MWSRLLVASFGAALLSTPLAAQAAARQHVNPVIDLLEQKKPVFGVMFPSNPRGGRGRGGAADAPPPPAPVQKTTAELAKDGVAYRSADFFFSGDMERGVDRSLPTFTEFMAALRDAGWAAKNPAPRLTHAIAVKSPSLGADSATIVANVSKQLNAGVNIVNFTHVNNAEEMRRGIAAMRFRSSGGTRPDDVGMAPALWGMTEQEYRAKADVWPLNPNGELLAAPIIESLEGVEKVREIAAVRGVGALIVGAGTLGGVYTTTNADGQRVRDAAAWEAAIQKILAACNEFNLACGYPVNAMDVATRLEQGFDIFIIQQWGEGAFRTVDLGRKAGGR